MTSTSVSVEDRIWFRIPFTVYWVGRDGGQMLMCLYRKEWFDKMGCYMWRMI